MNLKKFLDETLFKPLHMDDQITPNNEDRPIMQTEEVVETDEQVETAFGEPETHIQKDPSFNCQACRGEGLLTNGNLCGDCNGTGKKI